MHDVRIQLNLEIFDHLDGTDLADAPDIVPGEIEQHQVLGDLFGIGKQFLRRRPVFGCVLAAAACAGKPPDRDLAFADTYQDLRARTDDREIAEFEEEEERRGIQTSQRPVERERWQLERNVETLRWNDPKCVAGMDVFLRLAHHLFEPFSRDVRAGGRQLFDLACRSAGVGQAPLQIAEDVTYPLDGRLEGTSCREARLWPDRGDDGDVVTDRVENEHDRRPQEHAVWHTDRVRWNIRQMLHQPDHVVAHIADQARCHGGQLGRQVVDPALGDQGAERIERSLVAALEGVRIAERVPIDFG